MIVILKYCDDVFPVLFVNGISEQTQWFCQGHLKWKLCILRECT